MQRVQNQNLDILCQTSDSHNAVYGKLFEQPKEICFYTAIGQFSFSNSSTIALGVILESTLLLNATLLKIFITSLTYFNLIPKMLIHNNVTSFIILRLMPIFATFLLGNL